LAYYRSRKTEQCLFIERVMQLVYKDTSVFRILNGVVEIGDEKVLESKSRTDWLEAFSGQLNKAPRYVVKTEPSWFRKLNYTAPEILAADYIKPYEIFASQLGYDRLIKQPGKTSPITVLEILKSCRKLSH
jgi:hypothetical protein